MNRLRSKLHGLCACLLASLSLGCNDHKLARKESPTAVADAVYSRQKLSFNNVRVWKPSETEDHLASVFAPLIVQEISATSVAPDALVLSYFADTIPSPNNESAEGSSQFPPLARISFTWETEKGSSIQGIRITLDSNGMPLIWESLTDSTGKRVLYASKRLEEAAEATFGQPLTERRHSIEPPVDAAPKLIVARVLEDGPVPMGPIIYLSATNSDVVTIICRCMPSQASNVVDTLYYKLTPATHSAFPNEASLKLRWPRH